MTQLNHEQEAHYLDARAAACPFCRSPRTVGGGLKYEAPGLSDRITANRACNSCGATWTDHFRLSGVETPAACVGREERREAKNESTDRTI